VEWRSEMGGGVAFPIRSPGTCSMKWQRQCVEVMLPSLKSGVIASIGTG
jgi:hypothetical protein